MLTTAQTETERILGEHLVSACLAVDRGVELAGLSQDSTAVELRLRHADGSTEQATASWVIGADGTSSAVRELVGTKLESIFGRWRWVVADVDADHDLDLDCARMFLSAEGPVVAMPICGGRMRFLAQVHMPATPAANLKPTQDELQEIIDRRIGGIWVLRPHWLSYFQIHSAQVPHYRWGRVFLAAATLCWTAITSSAIPSLSRSSS
jgi:2-polyprenyl-6-methoxyphenol hydroxylase-like FAD-dependent oxidoreductase